MEDVKSKTNGHSEIVADAHGLDYDGMSDSEIARYGVELGIDWSDIRLQDTIARKQSAARKNATASPPRGAIGLYSFITWIGNVVMLIVMTTMEKVLIPLSVPGLAIIEYDRVRRGASIIEGDPCGVSFVVIMLTMGILFARVEADGSAIKFAYWSAVGAIMTLGTVGSIYENATPLSAFIGVLITGALYVGLEFVVKYNYQNYKGLLESVRSFTVTSSDEAANEARRQYMIAVVERARKRQQSR